MKDYPTDRLRNVALLGHNGSGKTTFSEAMLFASGATTRMGRVEDGTTTSDYDDEEKRRRQSLNLSIIPVEWKDHKINLIDTPGYPDFIGEVKSAVRVADLGLIFVDAVAGIAVGTELAMQSVEEANIPRAIMISGMDRENANYARILAELQEAFHQTVVPLFIPVGAHAQFSGVIDLLSRKYIKGPKGEVADIPADMKQEVDAAREKLIEAAAEGEDDLMEKFFDQGTLDDEDLKRGLRSAIRKKTFVPVMCAAASAGIGVHATLFSLINYAPAPLDRGGDPDDGQHGTILFVFKTLADPFVGKLSLFRVMAGPVHGGDTRLTCVRANAEERLSTLYVLRGKEQIPVTELHTGDIGMAAKLAHTQTGDTLADKAHAVPLPGIQFPNPLFNVALNPKSKNDTAKLSPSLARICEEDPSLIARTDPVTKEFILSGMGQTHVEVAITKLHSKFGVDVESSVPKVPYQETITKRGQARYRHKKQTGGAGQFAEIEMAVEPSPPGAGYVFEWKVFGGAISSSFQSSIEKGIKQVMETGVIAGYPIHDVKCEVLDGKEHPVDSKPIAFEIAARYVFREAFSQAGPILLEPIYRFTIVVPEANAGDVMGHLNTKRAQVIGMDPRGNKMVITADAPLAEMQRYSTDLRSLTQGRGFYEMAFQRYAPVPPNLAQGIIAAHKAEMAGKAEEE
ncbi:MAG: elongation factor G [Anaerolineae bacterium]|nr:elongation factor G [Thermoflexales bacterium]MDW8407590.1 elongation factor G [Anaerolineae bacterium]